MKKLLFILFTLIPLFAKPFTVASYNVENLFDVKYDGTEYAEYIPNTNNNWNKTAFEVKLNHLSQVLNEMNADIVALQEVESQEALMALLKKVPQYKYYNFLKNPKSAIGLAIISKYKLLNPKKIYVESSSTKVRPIQKVLAFIEHRKVLLFNNHWSSKKHPESRRIEYALALQTYLDSLNDDVDYILLGDFNSNYDEYLSLKNNHKLNDTKGITGINQILNTTTEHEYIYKEHILNHAQKVHYNLWLDLPYDERFSYIYRGHNNTPDHILLSASLFDDNNISYVEKSFKVFKPNYLYNNRVIKRWQVKNEFHQKEGYSDHLPIIATFDTAKYVPSESFKPTYTTNYLYKVRKLDAPLELKDMLVIYKANNHAILKQKDQRAIYTYNNAEKLELGYSYNLNIEKIHLYFGLKELKAFTVIKENAYNSEYERFYTNAQNIDIFDLKNQNEVIYNLTGIFKNGYLYFEDKKIKLYTKNKELLPKNGENITIMSGHLGYYKSQVQILIHQKSDFRVN